METNKQSKKALIIQRLLNEIERKKGYRYIWNLLLDLDKIRENRRNLYEWNQMNQTILEIDFDWTIINE